MTLPEKFFKTSCTFTSVEEIKAIAKPLESIGINYFTYDKTYDDGTHIRLTTHGHWIESYYREQLYNKAIFEKDINLFCSGHVFWSWLSREPIYSAAAEHDIEHGLTITQKQLNSCDFYHFGTSRNKPLSPEELIYHLNYLYRFIDSFREKAKDLIQRAEDTRIALPVKHKNFIEPISVEQLHKDGLFTDFLKKTEVRRLYLGEKFDNSYLTRKEINIVRSLVEGKKSVDIAFEMSLSERTLEVHISHIKDKFRCKTLFELGFMLGSLGPKSLYPFKIDAKLCNVEK